MAWKINLELSKQLPDADKSLDGERLRLVMEQADEKAIKNATDRGQLIWASHVRQLFTEAASMMRSSVRGLSGRLANELAGIDDPARCKSLVQSELDATLAGYARSLDQFGEPEASTEVGRTDN